MLKIKNTNTNETIEAHGIWAIDNEIVVVSGQGHVVVDELSLELIRGNVWERVSEQAYDHYEFPEGWEVCEVWQPVALFGSGVGDYEVVFTDLNEERTCCQYGRKNFCGHFIAYASKKVLVDKPELYRLNINDFGGKHDCAMFDAEGFFIG